MIFQIVEEFVVILFCVGVLVGLDFGIKIIGVVVSDGLCFVVMLLLIIWCEKFMLDVQVFLKIVDECVLVGLVLGLLCNMDGIEGLCVQLICVFVCNLEWLMLLFIIFWDECLFIVVVECVLFEVDIFCKCCVEVIDYVVVGYIL